MGQAMSIAANVGRGVAQAAAAMLLVSQGVPPSDAMIAAIQLQNAADYGRVAVGARIGARRSARTLD